MTQSGRRRGVEELEVEPRIVSKLRSDAILPFWEQMTIDGMDNLTDETASSEAKAEAILLLERNYLIRVIRMSHGNIAAAARLAGKERRAFRCLLQKHKIGPTNYR